MDLNRFRDQDAASVLGKSSAEHHAVLRIELEIQRPLGARRRVAWARPCLIRL